MEECSTSWFFGKTNKRAIGAFERVLRRRAYHHLADDLRKLHENVVNVAGYRALRLVCDYGLSAEWINRQSKSMPEEMREAFHNLCKDEKIGAAAVKYIEWLQRELLVEGSAASEHYQAALRNEQPVIANTAVGFRAPGA